VAGGSSILLPATQVMPVLRQLGLCIGATNLQLSFKKCKLKKKAVLLSCNTALNTSRRWGDVGGWRQVLPRKIVLYSCDQCGRAYGYA